MQLLKKYTLDPEVTLLYQFHAQKALFNVPKICNTNFWIKNDPPPFGTIPKNHPVWFSHPSLRLNTLDQHKDRQKEEIPTLPSIFTKVDPDWLIF